MKKVMANSVFYAALIGEKPVPLKERLGKIAPPRRDEQRSNEELP